MGVENASGTGEGVGRFDVKEEVVLKILLVGAPKSVSAAGTVSKCLRVQHGTKYGFNSHT